MVGTNPWFPIAGPPAAGGFTRSTYRSIPEVPDVVSLEGPNRSPRVVDGDFGVGPGERRVRAGPGAGSHPRSPGSDRDGAFERGGLDHRRAAGDGGRHAWGDV